MLELLAGVGWVGVIAAVFIAALSAWVQHFAARQLRAAARQRWFVIWINVLTVGSLAVVLAPTVLWFAAGWTTAGLALVMLLRTERGSRQARQGARRTAILLGIGDAALWAAVAVLLIAGGGDLTWSALADLPARLPQWEGALVALLLVAAALARSAQPPFHGWLPVTLAAPTPVSAIMHAGIVNASAFLVIRFAEPVTRLPLAMILLAVCGGAGMLIGAAGYLIRADLKGRLVASTTAQMGFLVLTLSAGAWGAALFHLIGHGVYKATLFLGSGSQIDQLRLAVTRPAPTSSRHRVLIGVTAALVPAAALAAATALLAQPVTASGLLLAGYGWATAAVLSYAVLSDGGRPVLQRALWIPGVIAGSAAYVAIVHRFDLLVTAGLPVAAWAVPGWALLVPLALVGALSLAPRLPAGLAGRAYGWVTLLAGAPYPRPSAARRRRAVSPVSTSPVEEYA
ncbi:MAG TPA: proton-conducting transporter membrane subunit [Pseudolysinimonas sp.]|nr:proton-conducting transporter membrane subunit [Pseudolysinimonas sp.]